MAALITSKKKIADECARCSLAVRGAAALKLRSSLSATVIGDYKSPSSEAFEKLIATIRVVASVG